MKLMVIDGNSIVNRAFYGIRMLNTSDGTPTNAVYGFLTILQRLLSDEEPDALCVTFDLRAPTFRHEMYEGYKAQRKGMPEELAVQMPILREVLDAMKIPRYECAGWEADDLIGTISRRCEADGWDCVIVTGDKDSFQLITDRTKVRHVRTRMGQTETTLYDVGTFEEEYGFEPLHMIDFKALMGDPSDNIPGVAGIGQKTAGELIRRFGSIDGIYEQIDSKDISESVRKKLAAGRDAADKSFDLVTIRTNAPIEFTPEENKRRAPDNDALYAVLRRLEFTKLIDRMGLTAPQETAEPAEFSGTSESEEISDAAGAGRMLEELKKSERVCVRVTPELDMFVAETDTKDGGRAFIVRSGTEAWDTALQGVFGGEVKKAGHSIKDTMRLLIEHGIETDGWIFDTALAAYVISPTDSSYELTRLTERYCGFSIDSQFEENEQLSLIDDQSCGTPRMLTEAAAVGALAGVFEKKLAELGMEQLYYDIELPLCRVLAEMEINGFLVDRQALLDFGASLTERIDGIESRIYELAGEEFNINSPKQLSTVLFEKLMLPAPKKTKTGYSTNAEVLEKLKNKHPVIGEILEYRELTKLKSTYADGLVKVISGDGRIHTNFQMTVTATGRLSSTEPNLQNIPVRKELGSEIRKMFIAGEGCTLVDADYSQIELRLLAHISGDEVMREGFRSGADIHRLTASQVFDTPFEDVTPLQRSRAKAVNFGIVYGISAFSLAQDIGVPVAEAKQYIDSYLGKYSGVREYMKNIVEQAKRDGYVSTVFGRRRSLPELKSSNFNLRSFGERVALNMPIQGTAADIIKLAMIRVSDRIKREKLRAKLILQVHDELIVECPEDEAETVSVLLREEMEHAVDFSVPLTVDTHTGRSWYDAK